MYTKQYIFISHFFNLSVVIACFTHYTYYDLKKVIEIWSDEHKGKIAVYTHSKGIAGNLKENSTTSKWEDDVCDHDDDDEKKQQE